MMYFAAHQVTSDTVDLYNKKTLTAEDIKNGLPIPQITFFWMWYNWKVTYYAKPEVLVLELNILFPGGGGGGGGIIFYTVIYYVKSEVLDLESNLLFLGGRG